MHNDILTQLGASGNLAAMTPTTAASSINKISKQYYGVEVDFNTLPNIANNDSVARFPSLKSYAMSVLNIIAHANGVESLSDSLTNIETGIIADQQITKSEKIGMIGTLSILKNSYIYWTSQLNTDNSQWKSLILNSRQPKLTTINSRGINALMYVSGKSSGPSTLSKAPSPLDPTGWAIYIASVDAAAYAYQYSYMLQLSQMRRVRRRLWQVMLQGWQRTRVYFY